MGWALLGFIALFLLHYFEGDQSEGPQDHDNLSEDEKAFFFDEFFGGPGPGSGN